MDKKVMLVIIVAAAVFIAAWLFMRPATEPAAVITNFEECVAAGNPVMESFPRQCRTADGSLFTEDVEPINGEAPIPDDTELSQDGIDPIREELLAAVRVAAADRAGVGEDEVDISLFEEAEWPDACLGLAAEDEMCAQVIVPGFRVMAEAGGTVLTYRTNADGTMIRLEE
jgi:hypothetical protein